MGLRACIDIDSLPLQMLLKANPGWAGTPVAVTQDEKPQSPILALNGEAREKGLAVGMRYSNALSLAPNLRARAAPAERIEQARKHIMHVLAGFSPDIEPCPFDADALWVSVDGLRSLFGTEALWSLKVRAVLKAEGFRATIVVGFTRFGTYAIARSRPRSMVLASREEERALVQSSPVDILPLPQRTKSTLRRLEIHTLGKFVSLPEGETIRRFGKEAGTLRRKIISDDPLPVQATVLRETISSCRHLDAPLVDLDLLMPHIDELLAVEAERAEAARSVIAGLTLVLGTEDGEQTTDLIRPAAPTLRTAVLRRLILLRLSDRQLSSGVEDIGIRCSRTEPSLTQEELFSVRGRDLQAGARAFAAIRARFGNDSVVHAELGDSWLPERSFAWVPVQRPVLPARRQEEGSQRHPSAVPGRRPMAVRRIFVPPRQFSPVDPGPGNSRDAFIVSGSWWGTGDRDADFLREYAFHCSAGCVLWVYADRLSGTSWVQGEVD